MKTVYIFILLLLSASVVEAALPDSLWEYLRAVDENYKIVVGTSGKSYDSIAATELMLGLLKANRVSLDVLTEDQVNPNINKILIGRPCDNGLVHLDMSCEQWPLDAGEAAVKIVDNDLVIAGTDEEAVVNAAEFISHYKEHDELKEFKQAIIKGEDVYALKESYQFECGDGECEKGERYFCHVDCEGISCFDKCQELGFENAECMPDSTNPRAPACAKEQLDLGKGYCASKNTCCCVPEQKEEEKKRIEKEREDATPVVIPKEKRSIRSTINAAVKTIEENTGLAFVIFILLVIIVVMLALYLKFSSD